MDHLNKFKKIRTSKLLLILALIVSIAALILIIIFSPDETKTPSKINFIDPNKSSISTHENYSPSNTTISQAQQTSLPLQFNTGNPAPYGLPSLTITIQGKKLPIILDTGAKKDELALTKKALENIQVYFTGNKDCSTSIDGKHCEEEFIIPQVQIGNFTIKNVRGTLIDTLWGGNDKNFKETTASKNGLIGFALLSKFNILLDYPHATIVFIKPHNKPENYDTDHWTKTPFTGQFLTPLKLNDKPMILSWDTGAVPSIMKTSSVSEFKKIICPTSAPYADKSCISIQTHSMKTMNGLSLPNTWFMLTDQLPPPPTAPFDGLVGSNFYAEHAVYFDFDNHVIAVEPDVK